MVLRYCIFLMVRGFLVLEDGTVLDGVSFGHDGTVLGEMVFITSMSGYQECLSDPAYRGQIVVPAFPLIGNYGASDRFSMSDRIHAAGMVVREYSSEPSDMYGGISLSEYLKANKVPGISDVDTRDLVSIIRTKGTIRAAIVLDEKDIPKVKEQLKERRDEKNLVDLVSSKSIRNIDNGKGVKVGILDCGVDSGLIKDISGSYDITVFPYDTKPADIKKAGIKALIISNGPGDPSHPEIKGTVVNTIKELSSSVPMMGLSFGACAVALAFGCRTMKMRFGHHGCNQPVKYGKRVHITIQNHLYDVDQTSMKGTGLIMDQVNVNDGSLEGFSHERLPVFGMLYYPVHTKYERDSFFYETLGRITGAKK